MYLQLAVGVLVGRDVDPGVAVIPGVGEIFANLLKNAFLTVSSYLIIFGMFSLTVVICYLLLSYYLPF